MSTIDMVAPFGRLHVTGGMFLLERKWTYRIGYSIVVNDVAESVGDLASGAAGE